MALDVRPTLRKPFLHHAADSIVRRDVADAIAAVEGLRDIMPHQRHATFRAGITSISLAVASFAVLAACSDRDQTIAPTASTPRQATYATAISDAPTANPNAKPITEPGFTKITVITTAMVGMAPGAGGTASAYCPAGTVLVGGGFAIGQENENPVHIYVSRPYGSAWLVKAANPVNGMDGANFHAWATCAS